MRRAVIAIDDKRILLMLHNRDEQALAVTEQRYGALCRSIARSILGSEQDAAECFNDALLRVWNTIPPANPDNFCAYLIVIVRNCAMDRYRAGNSEKRGGGQQQLALEELSELFPASDNVSSEVEQRELLAAVTGFLQKLPEKQRSLFIRRYWSFASYTELAAASGMRENHIQVTLSRIRKKLLKNLKEEGLL